MEDAVCMGCEYWTAHRRRTGAVATGALESWAILCGGLAEQERVRELLNKSRELFAGRLNGRHHGAWGSSRKSANGWGTRRAMARYRWE